MRFRSSVKKNKNTQNFIWNVSGNLIYAIIQWGLLIFLAQYGTPKEVGYYTLALAVTAPIALICNLQLRTAQVTDQKNKYIFKEYLFLRLITNLVLILLLLLNFLLYRDLMFLVIIIVGLIKLVENTSEILYGYYHKQEDLVFVSKSKLLKLVTGVFGFIIFYLLTSNLLYSLFSYLILYIFVFVFYDVTKIVKIIVVDKNSEKLKIYSLFKWTLPLGITSMLISLNTNLPRIILEKVIGIEAIGYYASLAYILYSGGIFINALGQVYSPKLSKLWVEQSINAFKLLTLKMLIIGFILGTFLSIFIFFFGDLLLLIVYGENYAKFNNILFLLSIGSIFLFISTYLGFGITATKNFKQQPLIMSIILLSNIIISLIFIKEFGMEGAAYSNILTSFITFIIQLYVLVRILREYKHEEKI